MATAWPRLQQDRRHASSKDEADRITGSKKLRKDTSMTTIKLGKHSEESYGQPQIP